MLLGIMSDSHDNMPQIRKAVDFFNKEGVSIILHAGDIVSPFVFNELKKLSGRFVGVFGNNDGEKKMWREKVSGWGEIHDKSFEGVFESKKLLMMHEPEHLEALAKSAEYDVIVFGHTHKPHDKKIGNTRVINPGECGGWLYGKSTVGILTLPENTFRLIEL